MVGVAVLSLILVLAVRLITLGGPAPPTSPDVPSPSIGTPLPTPTTEPAPAAGPGSYRFSERRPLGDPVVWERCHITYRLLLQGAPDYAVADVEEAIVRLEAATGFALDQLADGDEDPRPAVLRMDIARRTEGADIVIAWLPHGAFTEVNEELRVRGHPIAWTGTYYHDERYASRYDGALIVLDRARAGRPGFEGWWTHGMTLLHELGHAVGLGHVGDPEQTMYGGRSPDLALDDWGEGDLAGLDAVGAQDIC